MTHKGFRVAAAVVAALLVTGCSTPTPTPTPASPAAQVAVNNLPSDHVHAVAINPGDEKVYLATHQGLFRYGASGPEKVGPTIDLMGFSIAGPDHFYSSGHPGPGTELPNPVGLLESVDAGQTWTPLSLQGQSDFHLLAASSAGIIGFDGALKSTADGGTWEPRADMGAAPSSLTSSEDGSVVLAATGGTVIRSEDAGRTWTSLAGTPPIMLLDWASTGVFAGVTAAGELTVSGDDGATWQTRGSVNTAPQAITAKMETNGKLRILVATGTDLLESTDDGFSFAPLASR
ncbi:exo-alpha-sialidase [Nakamurella antarctica]|uniref:Exo-alpha-sialidase n=1 Tax=Nakamurella antarctica TaxID=1902245 RepID=A0A3G8ZR37_9ACTN|nr:exo-alpha-sialidase [Nakamurella antarctica]